MKPVAFQGSSLDDLRAFPAEARREAGHQLDRVQRGLEPDDWKPMPSVGPGVREVRVRDEAGAFRVIYTAARAEAVHVLHAFQKKDHGDDPGQILTHLRQRSAVAEFSVLICSAGTRMPG